MLCHSHFGQLNQRSQEMHIQIPDLSHWKFYNSLIQQIAVFSDESEVVPNPSHISEMGVG